MVEPGIYFSNNFSVTAWVNILSHNNHQRLIDFGNGENKNNFIIALSSGTTGYPYVAIHNVNRTDCISPQALPLSTWTFIAVTFKNLTLSIYIDGVKVIDCIVEVPENVIRSICYIGKSHWNVDSTTSAAIDELKIFDWALNFEELLLAGNIKYFPIHYWSFNQNARDVTANIDVQDEMNTEFITDKNGNSNSATYLNFG